MYTTLKVVYTLPIFENLPMFTGASLLGGDYGIDRVVELMQAAVVFFFLPADLRQ